MIGEIEPSSFLEDACRHSLLVFTMKAFEVLHPSPTDPFQMNWHIDAMCFRLQKAALRNGSRLILEVPPRHLKSICTSVALTAWLLGRFPSMKILVASYGAGLAGNHARDVRTLMNSPFYKRVFPNTHIDVDRGLEISTTAGGMRKAVSLGGEITGFGADLIIVDDLMKTADANSEAEIRNVQEFYDTSLVSRLNNQITGKIIVIQQRLGENDLVGYLKEKGNFEVLSLPSIAQCAEDIQLYGRKTHRRRIGDLLFPQRQPEGVLEKLRREIGNAAFAAHYLQNPTPPGGNRVRWEWFGSYSFEPLRSMFHYVIQSWDTGQSDLPTSSFSVCMTWGWRDGKWYLIDLARGQWRYGELKSRALELQGHWKPDIILVEKTANGHALISDLRVLHELRAVVRAVVPRLDKSLRLEAATAELETGKFLIPAEAVWLQNLKRDCMAFPNGSHDDQVDCLSQFVEWQKLRQELINTPMGTNGRRQTRRRRMRPQPCPWICRGALEQANADILNSQLLLSKLLHSVRDHGRCP